MSTLPSPSPSSSSPLHRLTQTLLLIDPYTLPPYPNLSIVTGPLHPPLQTLTLPQLLLRQTTIHSSRECLIIPWTGARWTYTRLWDESNLLARALLKWGVRPRDRVGIIAGNCEKYVAVFFACARVGAVCVTLNNTYTVTEVEGALRYTGCKILFTTPTIGRTDNMPLLLRLREFERGGEKLELKTVCLLRGDVEGCLRYEDMLAQAGQIPEQLLDIFDGIISPFDVVNLQFTSGSTGNPKAAMLTHHNLLNNAHFIGSRMNLTPHDILCCPPPLFHCFGLTLGLLATLTHGGKAVYPAEAFDAEATLNAISDERCTALHGVPAMLESILSLPRPGGWQSELRTGIVAGSPVPKWLMEKMVEDLGMVEFTSSYGLTEASPTVFNAHTTDSLHARLTTVGTVMPHARVKIIDRYGKIVPIGVRGELCVAGYQLCRGYWENPEKTAEVLVHDEFGELWLKTGDEGVLDVDGYCTITGRFKDIIIRGGENIYPLEIEERLVGHPAISRAIVVGVSHPRYVEVPVAFLQLEDGAQKPTLSQLKSWVRNILGRHKAPAHVLWLGEDCDTNVPLTGSGKIKKFILRELAEELMAR
ncbi:acetyl-CoA synthetase-like protein [Lindgomyces ingoldianus]|uniref:Acetyl-CoA synthetase-like protein n=1 Tax=Lindgomyces ingoldianus TaxID=673940 RepID=A0ACB6QPC7_9PLEO|nr:acetyl-CoA synthetase-like protein [Lindgomyces ingoldianus]KAF2468428.1 acetyl-CoA synthetase-like protein [Lindgomyces ingoldianus]